MATSSSSQLTKKVSNRGNGAPSPPSTFCGSECLYQTVSLHKFFNDRAKKDLCCDSLDGGDTEPPQSPPSRFNVFDCSNTEKDDPPGRSAPDVMPSSGGVDGRQTKFSFYDHDGHDDEQDHDDEAGNNEKKVRFVPMIDSLFEESIASAESCSFASSLTTTSSPPTDVLYGKKVKFGKLSPAERKRVIADCRTYRLQITTFEDLFLKEHGRMPDGSKEKAQLASVYALYREGKKAIRSDAACKIQSLGRGVIVRLKVGPQLEEKRLEEAKKKLEAERQAAAEKVILESQQGNLLPPESIKEIAQKCIRELKNVRTDLLKGKSCYTLQQEVEEKMIYQENNNKFSFYELNDLTGEMDVKGGSSKDARFSFYTPSEAQEQKDWLLEVNKTVEGHKSPLPPEVNKAIEEMINSDETGQSHNSHQVTPGNLSPEKIRKSAIDALMASRIAQENSPNTEQPIKATEQHVILSPEEIMKIAADATRALKDSKQQFTKQQISAPKEIPTGVLSADEIRKIAANAAKALEDSKNARNSLASTEEEPSIRTNESLKSSPVAAVITKEEDNGLSPELISQYLQDDEKRKIATKALSSKLTETDYKLPRDTSAPGAICKVCEMPKLTSHDGSALPTCVVCEELYRKIEKRKNKILKKQKKEEEKKKAAIKSSLQSDSTMDTEKDLERKRLEYEKATLGKLKREMKDRRQLDFFQSKPEPKRIQARNDEWFKNAGIMDRHDAGMDWSLSVPSTLHLPMDMRKQLEHYMEHDARYHSPQVGQKHSGRRKPDESIESPTATSGSSSSSEHQKRGEVNGVSYILHHLHQEAKTASDTSSSDDSTNTFTTAVEEKKNHKKVEKEDNKKKTDDLKEEKDEYDSLLDDPGIERLQRKIHGCPSPTPSELAKATEESPAKDTTDKTEKDGKKKAKDKKDKVKKDKVKKGKGKKSNKGATSPAAAAAKEEEVEVQLGVDDQKRRPSRKNKASTKHRGNDEGYGGFASKDEFNDFQQMYGNFEREHADVVDYVRDRVSHKIGGGGKNTMHHQHQHQHHHVRSSSAPSISSYSDSRGYGNDEHHYDGYGKEGYYQHEERLYHNRHSSPMIREARKPSHGHRHADSKYRGLHGGNHGRGHRCGDTVSELSSPRIRKELDPYYRSHHQHHPHDYRPSHHHQYHSLSPGRHGKMYGGRHGDRHEDGHYDRRRERYDSRQGDRYGRYDSRHGGREVSRERMHHEYSRPREEEYHHQHRSKHSRPRPYGGRTGERVIHEERHHHYQYSVDSPSEFSGYTPPRQYYR